MLWHSPPQFPELAEMAGLTQLHVACHELHARDEQKAVLLDSLRNLKELTLKNLGHTKEIIISSAAEMTKLSVESPLVSA
jgi:hypothetical protein